MDLLDKYPASGSEFKTWFVSKYNCDFSVFEHAPVIHQCEAIARCFGYKVEYDEGLTEKEILAIAEKYVYLYQQLQDKYPDGVPDFLQELKSMDFSEREQKYPEIYGPSKKLRSINEAIIALDAKTMLSQRLVSIRDAIIPFKQTVVKQTIPQPSIDDYWNYNFTKRDEQVPF